MVHERQSNSLESTRGRTNVWAALLIVFATWVAIWFIVLVWGKSAGGSLVGFGPFLAGAILSALCTAFVVFWRPTRPNSEHSILGSLREALAVMRDLLIVIVLGAFVYTWAKISLGAPQPEVDVHEAVPEELFQPWPR